MLFSGRTFCKTLRAPLARSNTSSNSLQIVRWNSSKPSPLTTIYRHQPPFTLRAPSYKRLVGLRSGIALLSDSRRGFATSSITARILRRVGQAGKLILVLAAGTVSLGIVLTSVGFLSIIHSPYLSLWPEELRKDLQLAGIARELNITGGSVEPLIRAWNTIQKLPLGALSPNPPVKVFSVAIWLADALEKDNQARRAYEVLCDVVALYRVRLQKSVQVDGANRQTSAASEERRYLISVLLKLASLSERYDPAAEGKWVSSALREAIELFPLCEGIPVGRFVSGISSLQELSEHDPSFSDLAYKQRKAMMNDSAGTSPDSSRNDIVMEDVYGDAAGMPLPAWAMPNVGTAIAGSFERVGLHAEKLGLPELALSVYDLAHDSLLSMTPTVSEDNVTIPHWAVLLWFLRIRNHQLNVHMHLLESDTYLADWLLRLYEARKALCAAERAMLALHKPYMKNENKWPNMREFRELHRAYALELLCVFRMKGIWLEKAGDNTEAMIAIEQSIILADIVQDKVAAQTLRTCLEKAERRRVEGKTTLAAQLTPALLKEWEEIQHRRRISVSKAGEAVKGHATEEH